MTFPQRKGREGGQFVQADTDPELEILILCGYQDPVIHLFNHDGTELPGWPIDVPQGAAGLHGASFGDLDGDGEGEIVACSDNSPNGTMGWTFAWHTDGSLVEGFPALTFGDQFGPPTVVDLNGDGRAEIIVDERRYPVGRLYVFGGDGQPLPGWPVDLDHVPGASAGAADIDGDGVLEIFYESFTSVHGLRLDGTYLPGFPFTPMNGDHFSHSAPTFADVDADGQLEIAFGAHHSNPTWGTVYLIEANGDPLPGWPIEVRYWVYSPPTFADLDDDGDLEIIAGDMVLGAPLNKVYAWHVDGSEVDGWPAGPFYAVHAQVAVADMDGDGDPELVWDDNAQYADSTGRLCGYHHDGSTIEGWPLHTYGSPIMNNATFGDVDLDGEIEIFVTSGLLGEDVVTFYLWDLPGAGGPEGVQMPMHQYGPGRDGVMRGEQAVIVPDVIGVRSRPALATARNPAASAVLISYRVAAGRIRLSVFDVGGHRVRQLMERVHPPGIGHVIWDGTGDDHRPLGAGLYFLRLETTQGAAVLKIVRTR